QQIDTPMALYREPANLFVATFLGSPAMNVLRARVVVADGGWLQLDDGTRIPLPPDTALAREGVGREWDVGIRPEDLHLAGPGEPHLAACVELVEPVGNEAFVTLRLGGQALVARLPPHDL